jgi:hypothetical protein
MVFDVVAAKQMWYGTGSEAGKRLERKWAESASGRVKLQATVNGCTRLQ